MLFATGHYDDAVAQFLGAFMIALATLVVHIIRYRIEVLYPTTLAGRVFFLAVIATLYGRHATRCSWRSLVSLRLDSGSR
ncbi:MAG: hypothetical protein ACKVQT_27725 [Burkholderiales bacterium]